MKERNTKNEIYFSFFLNKEYLLYEVASRHCEINKNERNSYYYY